MKDPCHRKYCQLVKSPNCSYWPYETPPVTLVIGKKHYSIPDHLLRRYPRFPPQPPFSSIIRLHDIHDDAGHSLVHFLYTGNYQTIKSPLDNGVSDIAREYRKSVFVYEASRKYGITDLEKLAYQYLQTFRSELSLSEILRETGDIFSRISEDETWFHDFIKEELRRILGASEIPHNLDELYKGLGQNTRFDNMVLKMVVEILHVRLLSMSKDGKVSATCESAYTNVSCRRTSH